VAEPAEPAGDGATEGTEPVSDAAPALRGDTPPEFDAFEREPRPSYPNVIV
jgi:hypothetical protein